MRAPELLSVWFALAGTAAALCGAAALLFGAPPPPPEPRTVRISFSPASAGTTTCRKELASGLQDAAERPAGFEMPDCADAHGASGRSGFAGGAAESVQLAERVEIPDGAERAPSVEIIPTADGGLPPAASVSASVPAAVPALAGVPAQAERIRARRTAGGGIRTDIAVGTRNADGLLSVRMADGSSRILLEPQKPVILISAEAAALIDGSRTVQI
nr:hypothetical protein [Treponemataceae bacterium]